MAPLWMSGDLSDLIFYPADGTAATDNYASFTFTVSDGAASSGQHTMTINIVPPGPIAATGMPTVSAASGTAYNEDVELTASTDGISDPNGINTATVMWQWQSAAAPGDGGAAPAESAYADINGATTSTLTPLQVHVGLYIRACVSFMDMFSTPTAEGPLCSAGQQVVNVNDVPTSEDAEVGVFTTATAADPFVFSVASFPFMDEDTGENSTLASVTLVSIPAAGTLQVGGAAATVGQEVMAADIGTITFYPADGTEAMDDYASFTFTVSDGLASSTPASTMTINVVPPGPIPATGMPTVMTEAGVTTFNEDAPLTADPSGVRDPNGIDTTTFTWQWQAAAPTADGEAPADGDFADISGATAVTLTPLQEHVGLYIRACVSFMDMFSTPTAEGPLCSEAVGPITDVDEAPVSEDARLDDIREAIALPPSLFPFTDADTDAVGNMLASVTIVTLPDAEIGALTQGGAAVTAGTELAVTGGGGSFTGGALVFVPVEEAAGETSFTFTVSDGMFTTDEATFTLMVRSIELDEEETAMVGQQVLTRVSEVVTAQVSGTLSGRIAAVGSERVAGVAGRPVTGTTINNLLPDASQAASLLSRVARDYGADGRVDLMQLLDGASFALSLGSLGGSAADGVTNGVSGVASGGWAGASATDGSEAGSGQLAGPVLWGRLAYREMDNGNSPTEDLTWDGSVATAQIGMDMLLADDFLVGLGVSYSQAAFEFNLTSDSEPGDYDYDNLGVHPYLAWYGMDNRLTLWGAGTWGTGEVQIRRAGASATSDASAYGASAGAGYEVWSGEALNGGRNSMKLKWDSAYTQTEIEGSDPSGLVLISALDVITHQHRLLLELSHERTLASGHRLSPSFELGVLLRANDTEPTAGTSESQDSSEFGYEAGAGWGYVSAGGTLRVDGSVRSVFGLDYAERGVDLSMQWDTRLAGRGGYLSLTPGWGQAASGGSSLYSRAADPQALDAHIRSRVQGASQQSLRVKTEFGYGMRGGALLLSGAAGASMGYGHVLTPYSALTLDARGQVRVLLGARLDIGQWLLLEAEAERLSTAGDATDAYGITFGSKLRF